MRMICEFLFFWLFVLTILKRFAQDRRRVPELPRRILSWSLIAGFHFSSLFPHYFPEFFRTAVFYCFILQFIVADNAELVTVSPE